MKMSFLLIVTSHLSAVTTISALKSVSWLCNHFIEANGSSSDSLDSDLHCLVDDLVTIG